MGIISNLFFSTHSLDFYASLSSAFLLLLLLGGLLMLVYGSQYILVGASSIARIFAISEFVIGITIVAISTSLPEFFVSVQATMKEVGEIALANVIGSNFFNIALIFMILSLWSKKVFSVSLRAIVIIISLQLLLLLGTIFVLEPIPQAIGIGALVLLGIYFYYEIHIHSHSTLLKENNSPSSNGNLAKSYSLDKRSAPLLIAIGLIVLGGLILYMGSEFFLNSARTLGYRIGISDAIIGILFVALGTSLPELMVTLVAIMRKAPHNSSEVENYQSMAEGNIVGSNLINILGVLGISCIASPIHGISAVFTDIVAMNIAGVLLLLLLWRRLYMQRVMGIGLLVLLGSYLYILARNML